jgi:uncharacterized protein involved in response to NO
MIHGFAGAAVGGFALTAVATWTKRPPVAGAPLFLLAALWLFARLLLASEVTLPFGIAADLAYGVGLLALMSREVVAARSVRNYKVLLILALLPVANALFFVGTSRGRGWAMTMLFAAMWLLVLLINLIAGRIIPAFTRNWMKRRVETGREQPLTLPPVFDRFDLLTTCLLVGFAVVHTAAAPPEWTAGLGVVTGALLFVRLARWQGIRALREPLVWVLHLAFAWIPLGVLLLSAAAAGLVPRTAGTHALTSGAIATMIVAVAGRAALGHTGRPLRSHPLLTAAYVAITVAAVFRVAATAGPGARFFLIASSAAWTAGFLCFAWRYAPILIQKKQQKPGWGHSPPSRTP